MDQTISLAIHHAFADPFRGSIMALLTEPRSWYFPLAMLVIGLVTTDWRRGVAAIATAVTAVGVGDGIGHYLLKPFFARPRPCIALPDQIEPLVGCVDSFSLPSNHAINSMAAAVALAAYFPVLRWPLVGVAGLVALTRVAVGVHYVTDVMAGALIGAAIGWGMARLAQRLGAPTPPKEIVCPE